MKAVDTRLTSATPNPPLRRGESYHCGYDAMGCCPHL